MVKSICLREMCKHDFTHLNKKKISSFKELLPKTRSLSYLNTYTIKPIHKNNFFGVPPLHLLALGQPFKNPQIKPI